MTGMAYMGIFSNVRYIQVDLTVSDSDGDADGGETVRLEAYTGIPALPPGEAAHQLPDLVAALAQSLVAAMQEELRAMEASAAAKEPDMAEQASAQRKTRLATGEFGEFVRILIDEIGALKKPEASE